MAGLILSMCFNCAWTAVHMTYLLNTGWTAPLEMAAQPRQHLFAAAATAAAAVSNAPACTLYSWGSNIGVRRAITAFMQHGCSTSIYAAIPLAIRWASLWYAL